MNLRSCSFDFAIKMRPLWPGTRLLAGCSLTQRNFSSGRVPRRRHSTARTLLLRNSFPALRPENLGCAMLWVMLKSQSIFRLPRRERCIHREVQVFSCFCNSFCFQLVYSGCRAEELAAGFLFQTHISNCLQM